MAAEANEPVKSAVDPPVSADLAAVTAWVRDCAAGLEDVPAAISRWVGAIAAAPSPLPAGVARTYEQLLDLTVVRGPDGRTELATRPDRRRRAGTHYTPTGLVDRLTDVTLQPLTARATQPGELTRLRIVDPACGAGGFLLAAAGRLARRAAELGVPAAPALRRTIVSDCVVGTDIDPNAVLIARRRLADWAGTSVDVPNVHRTDAFEFDWTGGGPAPAIDAVLMNPPFLNAIASHLAESTKQKLRARFPAVGGTADLAYYFIALAAELVAARHGRIGMVVPRAVLAAPAAAALRRELTPEWIDLPNAATVGFDADVAVAAVVIGDGPPQTGPVDAPRPIAIPADGNWWSALDDASRSARGADAGGHAAGPILPFELAASLIVADAYTIRPWIVDDASAGAGPKLVTTGLIDPDRCLWGERTCRYLRRRFGHPRIAVPPDANPPAALLRRLARAARPKVLIAGLAKRPEAWLDAEGESVGAVSTLTVTHADDDVAALRRLTDELNSDAAAGRLRARLGATALSGGNITVTKAFIRSEIARVVAGRTGGD
jgi:SAM-dependent methyltransferase